MGIEWRRPGTGRHDSRPGLRAKTGRSSPVCYRKIQQACQRLAGGPEPGETLLTQNRKHYLEPAYIRLATLSSVCVSRANQMRPIIDGTKATKSLLEEPLMEQDQVLNQDSLAFLAAMPDASIDSVITDPPYPNGSGLFMDQLID